MAQTMRAAQYHKESGKVLVRRRPIPEPEDGLFQVKIVAASLCHSDLMMDQRPDSLKNQPLTIGHEGVGIISKIHPSAENKGFKLGDKVGMLTIIDSCFACEGCVVHATFCTAAKNGGPKIQGLQADGVFADFAVTDWQNCIHLPENLPIERASPLFCAAFHAVNKCDLQHGQWLAVVDCGRLGQLAIQYGKAMGLKVIGLDINDHMLETATKNGANATFNPRKDPKFFKAIRKLTGIRGCHAAAVFSDSNAAYATGVRSLTFNGLLMVVGMPDKPLELPAFAVSTNLYGVKGASNGTAAELKVAVDFTARHGIIPDCESRELDEMPQMWEEMAQGKAKKKLVVLFGNEKSKM
ncbi:hypothetical protein CBER1_07853 [Cercospora berteroae]|uniref:Enoyl reductase (ER) domain-containing protein n=1 Tax=Cercospora berteroae TaxID=357750 RepID=A0A2S6C564_9PEZI|nr:hypothetical protein CBER1_07853 [Cercospora berteroae]